MNEMASLTARMADRKIAGKIPAIIRKYIKVWCLHFFTCKFIQLHTDREHDVSFQDKIFPVFEIRICNGSSHALILIQDVINFNFCSELFVKERIS